MTVHREVIRIQSHREGVEWRCYFCNQSLSYMSVWYWLEEQKDKVFCYTCFPARMNGEIPEGFKALPSGLVELTVPVPYGARRTGDW